MAVKRPIQDEDDAETSKDESQIKKARIDEATTDTKDKMKKVIKSLSRPVSQVKSAANDPIPLILQLYARTNSYWIHDSNLRIPEHISLELRRHKVRISIWQTRKNGCVNPKNSL